MVSRDGRQGFSLSPQEGAMSAPDVRGPVSTERLFRDHAAFVARLLYRLGVSADELDDVVQEVFLVVHRNGGYSPGPAKPTTYLANIAVRAASSHRRKRVAQRDRLHSAAPDELAGGPSPIELLERDEAARLLQTALDRLDPNLRAALVLVELEGESCTEVARGLGIPVGTVYWRLHRARKAFQTVVQALQDVPLSGSSVEGCES
jgi:RNA polymerase sigma-70 factor (ECF subfamily)